MLNGIRFARRAVSQTRSGWVYFILMFAMLWFTYGWEASVMFGGGYTVLCIVVQTIVAYRWDNMRGRRLAATVYYRFMGVRDHTRRPFEVRKSDS